MSLLNSRVREEAYKKEFISAMQAKGKLPRFVTDASERFDAAYHDTVPRIFPGPGGMETVLTNMLNTTEKRIDAAQPHGGDATLRQAHAILDQTASMASAEQALAAAAASTPAGRLSRHQVKALVHRTEAQLQRERQQRLLSEGKLDQAAAQQRGHRALVDTLKQATVGTLQERMVAQGKLPSHEPRVHATGAQQQRPLEPYQAVKTVLPSQQEAAEQRAAHEAAQQAQQANKRELRAKLLQVEESLRRELEHEVAARQHIDQEVALLRERVLAAQAGRAS